MMGSMMLIVAFAILIATAALASGSTLLSLHTHVREPAITVPKNNERVNIAGNDPNSERQPGDPREVPPEVRVLAYVSCAVGIAGALIVSGKLRDISVPTSTVDMNTFNKSFTSFNTRTQFLRPKITGFVTS